MDNLLNAQTLWEGFDPTTEQLETLTMKQAETDGIVTKSVYFTGRTLGQGKSRVFAEVCYKESSHGKPAVLVVGNYTHPIEEEVLLDLANHGFVAMAIDYAGKRDFGLHTLYPEELSYCNEIGSKTVFEITETAKETKLFEYALNSRRALTYLLQEEKAKSVSVLASGKGVYVGIIVMGVDARVNRGAILFGNLYRNFPAPTQEEIEDIERHVAYDARNHMWTLALAPQTYVMQIKAPIYVVNSANSAYVDLMLSSKTFLRLNGDSRMLILPNTMDYLTTNYVDGVVNWLKGVAIPEKTELKSFFDDNGDYCLQVAKKCPLDKTSIWYCTNDGRAKYWTQASLVETNNGYVAKVSLYEKECNLVAFAMFDADIPTSTLPYTEHVVAKNIKKASNIIFSGTGKQFLIPIRADRAWWNVNLQPTLAKGYLNIVGAKGKALATFALNNKSLHLGSVFTLCLDICCNVPQVIKLTAVRKFGDKNECYSQTAKILGNGTWERISFDTGDLHREADGKQLPVVEEVDMLIISADSEFIVNNIFLV